MNIQFSPPYIDEDVVNEVVDCLRSGWITTGSKVKALENEIKELSGAKQVLCVNSWTSGAIMMLRWLGVKAGDEVIIPAYTYSATALAVIHAGAKPVMVDIAEDFNISIEAIEKAITPRTKAIIPVDFAGFPCDYDKILAVIEARKDIFTPNSEVQKRFGRIMVLSDAAHSIGARYNGKYVGSQCDVVIFSLHAVKNITTAEGGAICLNLPETFNNSEMYNTLRTMSLNCQTKDAFTKSKAGGWQYDIIGLGMKVNMADINAAIGLAQIKKYPQLLQERKYIFDRYDKIFKKLDWVIAPASMTKTKESSCHIYALRLQGRDESFRNRVIDRIASQGIAVNVHFIPMPMLTFFRSLGYDIQNFPVAYNNYRGEISLPIYPGLTDEQVDYIINAVVDAYKETL